ncbi:hypothetical protein FRC08_005616 [Ceratobasidium sp. 394]|nr:hypothetical protein FRC08_005616 [Ceratobasidium sp. 394]KAG9101177.1 hypothetical protein FS749_009639 [Ceratobasidium sp. UAMH 11750]
MAVEPAYSFGARPVEPTSTTAAKHSGSLSSSNIPGSKSLMPTPQRTTSELTAHMATLRAELRDGRLLQARQRSQITQDASRIRELEVKLYNVKQARENLQLDLKCEQNATRAAERRLEVAAVNHSKAIDQCARQSAETEVLRLEKGQVEAELQQKSERLKVVETLLKQAEEQSNDAEFAGGVEAHLKRQLKKRLKGAEERATQLKLEQDARINALEEEVLRRNHKIQKLEIDLKRQREINAMFTIEYDRETHFTKAFNIPVSVPSSSSPVEPSKSRFSSRTPLTDFEINQRSVARKRTLGVCDDENSGHPSVKSRKLEPIDGTFKAELQSQPIRNKKSRPARSYSLSTKDNSHLPAPDL